MKSFNNGTGGGMHGRSQAIAGYVLAALVALAWIAPRVLAAGPSPVPAPEIDGSTVTAGLGLITAGVLIIRSRRSK
jgi:hypothetical protein